jgi:hypothetical protein
MLLITLWALFFWRLLTPIAEDQASFTQGDFSGQFVAFGGYQYARISQGEIPLWNPYNNGGLPFIADTQTAVFYPPRLLTIALSALAGGWTYHALELEAIAHVLIYTLLMYAFVRRLTREHPASIFGALVAAVTAGYGGYVSGYPPLQLALLEAGIWLPLAALGILEATRAPDRMRWPWLLVTGFALGLSWMAGHPQTSYFLTFFLIAYCAYRTYHQRRPWRDFVAATALFGVVSIGLVAVTLLPGLEYLTRTSRSGLGFDAKGGGFPIQDIAQLIFPGVVSLWSPLYFGVIGLTLALAAVWKRLPEAWFWFGTGLVALMLSTGASSALFHLLYNVLPGLRYFRGQERSAYLFANATAILVGLGAVWIASGDARAALRRLRLGTGALAIGAVIGAGAAFALWLYDRERFGPLIGPMTFSALIAVAAAFLVPAVAQRSSLRWLLAAFVVFELFSVNMDGSNYDPIPPSAQLEQPPLLDVPLADTDIPFRVDGFRGLNDNYGSLYGLADIQGISPLFLDGPQQIIEHGLPDERAWELFAVRYVYSDWDALNVPGIVVASGEDRYGPVNLHQLTAPRPYAHLVYETVTVSRDDEARALLADPEFDARRVVILHRDPILALTGAPQDGAGTTITRYEPEALEVIVNTPENAILSLAHVDYPGWQASLDGQPVEIIRAYGGLTAIEIPAGQHTLTLAFTPRSYQTGAVISLVTWAILAILAVIFSLRNRRHANG